MLRFVVIVVLLWPVALFAGDADSSAPPRYDIEKLELPFPGYLYKPVSSNQTYPAIVVLHGSEGGNGDYWYFPGNKPGRTGEKGYTPWLARKYAEKGYVTLALCYFDCRHHWGFSEYPPDELVKVDIEGITQKAIAWLRTQDYVGGKKVGLLGFSRGAEQAILLASLSAPDAEGIPDAVASLSPADKVAEQISKETAAAIIRGEVAKWPSKPAWTYGDYTPPVGGPIEVEKFQKPLLITFFWNDPVWGDIYDPSRTIYRYKNAGIDHYYKKIVTDQINENTFQDISATSSKTIFIEYDFSGHVYPDRNKEPAALQLQIQIIDWFFNQNLKN